MKKENILPYRKILTPEPISLVPIRLYKLLKTTHTWTWTIVMKTSDFSLELDEKINVLQHERIAAR